MDRRLRNRIVIFLVLALIVIVALVWLTGRQPVAKISAVTPVQGNLVSSISSNGKVEPIGPFVMRAQLDTFVEKISAVEGQQVKKGQLLLELNVKDAAAQLAEARSKLLRAEDDLRAAKAGGRSDDAAKTEGQLAAAVALRDRLQRNHDSLERLIAQQAATKDELAANDLDLAKANAQVKQLTAVKQEFEHGVKLDANRTALQVEQLRSEVAALEEKVRDGRIVAPAAGTLCPTAPGWARPKSFPNKWWRATRVASANCSARSTTTNWSCCPTSTSTYASIPASASTSSPCPAARSRRRAAKDSSLWSCETH